MREPASPVAVAIIIIAVFLHKGAVAVHAALYGWDNSFDLWIPLKGSFGLTASGLNQSIDGLIFCYNIVSENINGTPVLFIPVLYQGGRGIYVVFPDHSYLVDPDKYTGSPGSTIAYAVKKDNMYLFMRSIRIEPALNQSIIMYRLARLRVRYSGVSVMGTETVSVEIHNGLLPVFGLSNIFSGITVDDDMIVAWMPAAVLVYSISSGKTLVLRSAAPPQTPAVHKYRGGILLWNGTHILLVNKSLEYTVAHLSRVSPRDALNYTAPMFYRVNNTIYIVAGYDVIRSGTVPGGIPQLPGGNTPIYVANKTVERYMAIFRLGEDPLREAPNVTPVMVRITENPQLVMTTDYCGWYVVYNATIYVLNTVFNNITDLNFYYTDAVLQAISFNGTVLWKTRLYGVSRYIYLLRINNNRTELAIPARRGLLLVDPHTSEQRYLPLGVDGVAMITPLRAASASTKLYIFTATKENWDTYSYTVYVLSLTVHTIETLPLPEPWAAPVLLAYMLLTLSIRIKRRGKPPSNRDEQCFKAVNRI